MLSKRKGFTLVELLVVVLIIGILAAVALPQYRMAVEKARISRILNLLAAYNHANAIYYLANAKAPADFTEFDIDIPGEFSLNSNKTTITSGKMRIEYCRGCSGGKGSFMAYPNTDIAYYLSFSTDNNSLYCWAGKEDELANKICRAYMGVEKVGSTEAHNYYYIVGH